VAQSPLSESLGELARFFVGDRSTQDTLTRVTELTVEAIPAADMAGITLVIAGCRSTAVFTDELAPDVDQAQYATGSGPCLTAFEERRITSIDDTSEPGEWCGFRRAAAERGIGSTLSFPLLVDEASVGALNLYASAPRAFEPDDRPTGQLFADQAAIVLANAHAYWGAHDLSCRLSEAMESRWAIEQAKGILMATNGLDADQAFELLVCASQRENKKVRDIARRMVQGACERAHDARLTPSVARD